MTGAIRWFTGMSVAGKSTLATACSSSPPLLVSTSGQTPTGS